MANSSPRLVVRTYVPLRRRLLVGGGILLMLVALYAAFESGRLRAGYDSRATRARISDLRSEIRELEAESRRQRLQLAAQETDRVGQARERAELSKAIGDLQAEVGRQAQDLAFYRGVVGENLQAERVRIQQFKVVGNGGPDEYLLKLVLGRPLRPEDVVSGTVRITLEGMSASKPVNLDLGAVSTVADGELKFSYRYVQTLEQAIRLPHGFEPARTTVELQPTGKGASPVRQTFLWAVETA